MELLERLGVHARERPGAAAVRMSDPDTGAVRVVTYDELYRSVTELADRLRARVGTGAVVALGAPTSAEFAAAYLGALWAGCIVHPVPQNASAGEVRAFLEETGTRMMIGEGAALEAAGPGVERVEMGSVRPGPGASGIEASDPDSPGLYLPSSGTTGLPKIAVRSRRSLDAVARNVARAARLDAADGVLAAVPVSHSYGMENGLLGPIWAGSCIHVMERGAHADVGNLLSELQRGLISVFPAVPFMVDVLGQLAPGAGVGTGLRLVYTAGSPLPPGVAERFGARFGRGVGQLYGATEVGSVTFAEPGGPASHVGMPLPGVSILILDPWMPDVSQPLASRETGQVAVRASSMLSHYLGGDRSDPAFLDGYFLTGDLGRLDEGGSLEITGRIKLLIDVGGFKVNPLEVERALAEHPSVGEVVVLPVPVTETVSRLRAVIAPASGPVSIEELRRFARQRLAAHKVPRVFEVVDRLPKSPTGKVLRREMGA